MVVAGRFQRASLPRHVRAVTGLYYSFREYLGERYPFRVRKIPLAAGFTCPNIDGRSGTGGCIYCNNLSFSPNAGRPGASVARQIREGMSVYGRHARPTKFIAYFQAHSNTYGPLSHLKDLYDSALAFPDVIGLSVGTRPDCVPDESLDLLVGYKRRAEVWVEYGVESSHDETLRLLNRCHDFAAVADAVGRTKGRGLMVCAHVILGLPGESREKMMQTARRLSDLGVDAVKIHHLYVSRNTRLERLYREGNIRTQDLEGYLSLLADFLERLPAGIVIQRLIGELAGEWVLAPDWKISKVAFINRLERHMRSRGQYQGRLSQNQ